MKQTLILIAILSGPAPAFAAGAPDMRNKDLIGAEMTRSKLSGAQMRGARLRMAHLEGSDLSGADLSGADLRWSDLKNVNLKAADLTGALLQGADLVQADFTDAKIDGAQWKGAYYDDRTHLPFGKEKAASLGLVLSVKTPKSAPKLSLLKDAQNPVCENAADANDRSVLVGDVCVDRYESSVWSAPDGGVLFGTDGDDYPCQDNAQDCAAGETRIYARSVPGVRPSGWITWFQANVACANAGKHLITNAEWQAAAAGTPDPGTNAYPPACVTFGDGPAITAVSSQCRSSFGAENMVGSLWEWVAQWGVHPGWSGELSVLSPQYGSDGYWHGGPADSAHPDRDADGSWRPYAPAAPGNGDALGDPVSYSAVARGGHWRDENRGNSAGVFSLGNGRSPSDWRAHIGFRCARSAKR